MEQNGIDILEQEATRAAINWAKSGALDKNQEQHLHDRLMEIAEDGVPRQHRGMHR